MQGLELKLLLKDGQAEASQGGHRRARRADAPPQAGAAPRRLSSSIVQRREVVGVAPAGHTLEAP